MAVPNTPMVLPKKAQEGVIQFHRSCYAMLLQNWNIREQMRQIDLAYIRENDWTPDMQRAKIANRYGDANKMQNIVVPVVMPQVEAAVAYQSSVFLTGQPIFESVAHPQYENAALQMNAILEDQSTRGGWVRQLQMFIRDGFKYNQCAIEVRWDSIVTAALETDLSYDEKEAKPKNVVWDGNILQRLDPYNTLIDTRCAVTEIPSKGEFAGYTQLYSRTALKDFINKLPSKIIENIVPAFESGVGGPTTLSNETYYLPLINPYAVMNRNIRSTTDWMAWAGIANPAQGVAYKNLYEVTVLYGRIIPNDFGLKVPGANTPQVWKFIVVNNQVLIYAERQTNAHNLIPILFGQPLEDGLTYQTKSLATNATPFQDVASALMNSSIAASRKAIFDRTVYDPSRIREADINNPNPASKIPVRPAAYGKPVTESFATFPFRDDQSPMVFEKIQQLQSLTDEVTGRNRAQRGLFTKGNRTKEEYVSIMQNASGRDMCVSMLLEAQVFTPMKNILKLNILQYQGGTKLYSQQQQQPVQIDPVVLRNAVINFKMADGLDPVSKEINADTFTVSMQTLATNPQIAAGYNVAPMFSYLMKTQGADLKPFEKSPQQQAYEQAVQAWQQSIQQVAASIAKLPDIASVEQLMKTLPPQPQPQQYGYNPAQTNQPQTSTVDSVGLPTSATNPTIMQQVSALMTGTPGANVTPGTQQPTGGQ